MDGLKYPKPMAKRKPQLPREELPTLETVRALEALYREIGTETWGELTLKGKGGGRGIKIDKRRR